MKKIILPTLFFFSLSSTLSFGVSLDRSKSVTLYTETQVRKVVTTASTVGELLRQEGITIHPEDFVFPTPDTPVRKNLKVMVRKAKQVTVKLPGTEERKVWTTAQTVGGLLEIMGVHPDEEDQVTPRRNTPIIPGLKVEVVDVSFRTIAATEAMMFQTKVKETAALAKGEKRVSIAGIPGEAKVTYKARYHDGKLVDLIPMQKEVVREPKDQVVLSGTAQPVSLGGYAFSPRKVLTGVKLTAYGPGEEHTGKNPGDPGYGITRSGLPAKEGRTVAVDPDLIPLGWWIYIEGFGLYRAEDTGSAVKGKKIDLFFADDQKAEGFGLKRGYTVYVIGPEKPTAR